MKNREIEKIMMEIAKKSVSVRKTVQESETLLYSVIHELQFRVKSEKKFCEASDKLREARIEYFKLAQEVLSELMGKNEGL